MLKRDVILSRLTTIGIGGEATVYFPRDLSELIQCSHMRTIGRGSNLLVTDSRLTEPLCSTRDYVGMTADKHICRVLAGTSLSKLALELSERWYSGYEWATGIPGSVGGAVVMNAGAYGSSMQDVVIGVDVIENGRLRYIDSACLGFDYRHSAIKDGMVVAAVYIRLERGDPDLIAAGVQNCKALRRQTQPAARSMGSVFKRYDGVSAGYYIDKCGLKGLTIGGAQVSRKHAGFIINTGSATYDDVSRLIDAVWTEVYRRTGVQLTEEIRRIDR